MQQNEIIKTDFPKNQNNFFFSKAKAAMNTGINNYCGLNMD